MSFKKFVTDNIVDFGGDKNKAKEPATKIESDTPPTHTVVFTESTAPTYGISPDLEKARQKIADMLKGANAPGIDYYEFAQALSDLSMIDDDVARYKTAYTMLSKMGLTKAILNSSIDTYTKRLDDEIEKIKEASSQIQIDIRSKESVISSKQSQIDALQDQISQLRAEVSQAKQNVDKKTDAFVQAANESKQEMQTNKAKINSLIIIK